MQYFLFFIYLIICTGIIFWFERKLRCKLNFKMETLPLYLLRVLVGLTFGFFVKGYNNGGDYWAYNTIAYTEDYQMLKTYPIAFIKELFYNGRGHYGNFFSSADSFWNDMGDRFLLKVLAVFNFLSDGNYYINALFLNTICFIGCLLLYKVFYHAYDKHKPLAIISVFLLPSFLIFTSGIHKEAELLLLVSVFTYCLYFGTINGFNFKKCLLLILSFLFVLFIRNYIAIGLILPSLVFFISKRRATHPLRTTVALITFVSALIIIANIFYPSINPWKIISDKKNSYLELGLASSQVSTDTIPPSFAGVASATPAALSNTFLRPLPLQQNAPFTKTFIAEILLFIGLLVWAIVFPDKKSYQNPFVYYALLLSIIIFVMIGLTIPNLGSIIRYRSLFYPYLFGSLYYLTTARLKHIKFKNI